MDHGIERHGHDDDHDEKIDEDCEVVKEQTFGKHIPGFISIIYATLQFILYI